MRMLSVLGVASCLLVGCNGETSTGSGSASDAATAPAPAATEHVAGVAASADQVKPIGEGRPAPSATMETVDGEAVAMSQVYAARPTVLVFYRGGWCPYCNRQLEGLAKIEPELLAMGYQIVAVSPDRPAELASSIDKQALNYTLLSDGDAELIKAFGLAFQVDQPTITKYQGYGIDLEASSGHDHHLLPVPAVYVIDTDGTIRYAYWDADYKQRLSGEAIVAAAKRAAG